LGGPQSRSGRCEKEKYFGPAGNRTPTVQPVARRYTDWETVYKEEKIAYFCSVNLAWEALNEFLAVKASFIAAAFYLFRGCLRLQLQHFYVLC
jgi:hypothetical protein